jgi:hypothetical protein
MPFMLEESTGAWEVGYSAEDDFQRLVEFIRPGQTVETWTELVTVNTFNKADGLASIDDQMAGYRKALVERCPGSTVDVTRPLPDGILYEAHITGGDKGPDEEVVARVVDGTSNRFVVHYSVRAPVMMTPERRTEWIEKLMAVQLLTEP